MYEFNTVVGLLTIAGQIGIAILAMWYFFPRTRISATSAWLGSYGFTIATILAVLGMIGPLVYSEFFTLPPCELCWYQRIFMFSSAFLLLLGSFRKEIKLLRPYLTMLLGIGATIGAYQYLLQVGALQNEGLCDVAEGAASCADIYVLTMGYITIPLMSVTLSLLILLFLQLGDHQPRT